MDVQDEELLHFWKCLARHNVRYMMVGGFATRFHGFNRSTEDLDIWLEDTIANRQQLRKVFVEIGYGDVPLLETIEFIPGWTNFYIAGVELDIITSMKGLENITFDECLEQASIAELEGVKIPFLHINQLIQNKKPVNCPKDQIDVIELERIRDVREQKQ